MSKKIVAIWAQDRSGLIGKNQRLPWHLPADLEHFKKTTLDQAILMGRLTFEGMGKRLLPRRTSLILTTDQQYELEEERALVFHDRDSVLAWYEQQEKILFIVGGGQIFSLFEEVIDELIITEIEGTFEGDTYFPEDFDRTAFVESDSYFHQKDEKNPYDFRVRYLQRKGS